MLLTLKEVMSSINTSTERNFSEIRKVISALHTAEPLSQFSCSRQFSFAMWDKIVTSEPTWRSTCHCHQSWLGLNRSERQPESGFKLSQTSAVCQTCWIYSVWSLQTWDMCRQLLRTVSQAEEVETPKKQYHHDFITYFQISLQNS